MSSVGVLVVLSLMIPTSDAFGYLGLSASIAMIPRYLNDLFSRVIQVLCINDECLSANNNKRSALAM